MAINGSRICFFLLDNEIRGFIPAGTSPPDTSLLFLPLTSCEVVYHQVHEPSFIRMLNQYSASDWKSTQKNEWTYSYIYIYS